MAEGACSTRHPTAPVSHRVQMPQTSPAPHRLLDETNLIPITTRQLCLPPKLRVQLRLASRGEGPQTLFSPLEMLPLGAREAAGLRRHRGEGSSSGAIAPLPGGAIQLPQLHCVSKPCSLPPSPRKSRLRLPPNPPSFPALMTPRKQVTPPRPRTPEGGTDGGTDGCLSPTYATGQHSLPIVAIHAFTSSCRCRDVSSRYISILPSRLQCQLHALGKNNNWKK